MGRLTMLLLLLSGGCALDRAGLGAADAVQRDAGASMDADPSIEGGIDDAGDVRDGPPPDDAGNRVDTGGCGGCPWGCEDLVCIEPEVPNVASDNYFWLTRALGDLVIDADATLINAGTDAGEIRREDGTLIREAGRDDADTTRDTLFERRGQGTGISGLSYLIANEVRVAPGATLRIAGGRSMVIIATAFIGIDGMIDASASQRSPGSGGYDGESGPSPGSRGARPVGRTDSDSGGGGAGHGGTGGRGGDADPSGTGGAGGAPFGDGTLVPLQGGSGGAHGLAPSADGRGGAGGGALQLVSNGRIGIGATGVLHVGGGGGGSDIDEGGGGGGAGGAVMLFAPMVTVDGIVAANGGGGGGVGADDTRAGEDGHASTTRARGGAGPEPDNGAGGAGGAGILLGGSQGNRGVGTLGGGGGGGGAVGRIRIVTRDGMLLGSPTLSPAATTPAFRADLPTPRP